MTDADSVHSTHDTRKGRRWTRGICGVNQSRRGHRMRRSADVALHRRHQIRERHLQALSALRLTAL